MSFFFENLFKSTEHQLSSRNIIMKYASGRKLKSSLQTSYMILENQVQQHYKSYIRNK